MFELPASKRVRREDIYASRSPTPTEPDAGLAASFQKQLENLYGVPSLDVVHNVKHETLPEEDVGRRDEGEADNAVMDEGFEFRLFAAAPKQSLSDGDAVESELTKVILDAEDEVLGDGAFVQPFRRLSFFFTGEIQPERRKEFELSAVSGEDVRRWLGVSYPAWKKPWKVKVVKVSKKKGDELITPHKLETDTKPLEIRETETVSKKRNIGKKRRILLRKRQRAEEELKTRTEKELAAKDEAEREKKTRRNKEKKLKRRAKEKAMKAEAVGADMTIQADSPTAASLLQQKGGETNEVQPHTKEAPTAPIALTVT